MTFTLTPIGHVRGGRAEAVDDDWGASRATIVLDPARFAPDALAGLADFSHAEVIFLFDKVPDDKILCPGVIECQSNYIEHPEVVAQRIERYARLVGRERVMAGVDCGFSIHAGMQGIDPDVVWAKLEALAKGAEIATRRLWGS